MIQNLVFDMGNVLLVFDPEHFMTRSRILDPLDRKIVRNELFHSLEWAQMDLGVLTEDEAEPMVLSRIPERLWEKARFLLHHWADEGEMIPGMEDLVYRLKKAGYRIYLLSNASKKQPEYWNRISISQIFDGTLVSAFYQTVKPGPDIFRIFLQKYNLKAEECVFVDDSHANAAGAEFCGMKGIVFHGDADELERKLELLGVKG